MGLRKFLVSGIINATKSMSASEFLPKIGDSTIPCCTSMTFCQWWSAVVDDGLALAGLPPTSREEPLSPL